LIYFERKSEAALRLRKNGKKKGKGGVYPTVLVPRREGGKGGREKRGEGEKKEGKRIKGNMK
jgi:hypothetical protein